jgi:hypothetical protein
VVVAGGLVAAFGGGAYMTDRFSSVESDFDGRMRHWQLSLSMLQRMDDFILGKGLGRYVESYAIAAPEDERPGDYRLVLDGDNQYLTLVEGAKITADTSAPQFTGRDVLRISQRVHMPAGLPQVKFDVRASEPVNLHFAICTKHLIYPAGCLHGGVSAKPQPGVWQRMQVQLRGNPLSRGAWYAPRLVVFTIATDSPNRRIEIDNVVLSDAEGMNLLSNGDFSEGMAGWFVTSDRNHLPWHAKNLGLHVLFEQGVIGLVLMGILGGTALWRVSVGNGRGHPLAPSLAGALVGFGAVGLFDSLVDVPRVAFVFFLLLLIGVTLRAPPYHFTRVTGTSSPPPNAPMT